MKLSLDEAEALLRDGAHSHPSHGALERLLAHEWSFDPRGGNLRLLLRRYHEQDQLLYETFTDFQKVAVHHDPTFHYPALCVFCALTIRSVPYYTARNPFGTRWEICRECFDVIHRVAPSVASDSPALRSCSSLDRLSAVLSRCLSRCLSWFRRSVSD